MINEKELENLCTKYGIRYQFFETTNIALLYDGINEWQIEYFENRDRPYYLSHKNTRGSKKRKRRCHEQNNLRNLYQAIHSIYTHKKVLYGIRSGIPYIHKHNMKINKEGKICLPI